MTQYIYDAEGRRVRKGAISTFNCNAASNGFSLTNVYIPGPNGQQLTEISVGGGRYSWGHTNVWAGDQLIATDSPNGTGHVLNFEFNDWLGTRRVLTDSAGNIQQTCPSLPYGNGEPCPTTPTEHLFTQHERDAESGNDYFKYRYYASSMGRWLSPDPSGLSSANLSDPQSLNLYDYVGNKPLTLTDLEGLCWRGFSWACMEWNRLKDFGQMTANWWAGYGFQTDEAIDNHPNERSQRKIEQNREDSYRRETQPAPSLPKPGTPHYIDLNPGPGPYVPKVTVSARHLTPMPPRLAPQDCLVPDAKGYHEVAMLAWENENGLPLNPSGPSDVNDGEGVAATYVQMKGGSSYPEKIEPSPSEMVPNASAGGAAAGNNAALLFAYGAEVADCEGTR